MTEHESGWYLDPSGRHRLRYWNGVQWTDQVNDGNVNFADPIEQEKALVPPAPGTRPAAQAQQQPQVQQPSISVQTSQPHNTTVGILIGALVIVVLVIGLLIVLDDDNNDNSNTGGGGDGPLVTTTSGSPETTTTEVTTPSTTADSGTDG